MFRTLFLVQTAGIIIVLLLHVLENGMQELTSTPVWYVFILTAIVSGYLQMDVTVDNDDKDKAPPTYFYVVGFIGCLAIAASISFIALAENSFAVKTLATALLFIACYAPFSYALYLKTKKAKELNEE
ncbi:hypothetical protein FLK61_26465 [Paenalkalicoccus suaedae]|uniref:Uncharacterized protein n=2 Tax=Paenalkalicoccus suaedae TaxID=2592382 RepID=A0A859FDH4_9BACI|nr:hypothetical protein FLK61_26465 [Paenalkalicoccus suaedae]